MIFITTACGDAHRKMMERMERSFIEYGWPPLICVSDEPCDVRNAVIAQDDLWKGRGLKTRFAHFAPNGYTGPIAYIDCDCEAIDSPPEMPNVPLKTVGAIVPAKYRTTPPKMLLQSTILLMASALEAKEMCDSWHARLKAYPGERTTDEIALNHIVWESWGQSEIGATYDFPLPSLYHYGSTSRSAHEELMRKFSPTTLPSCSTRSTFPKHSKSSFT